MIDAVTLTTLIPGSIWKKEGRRRDFYSTVLFVTNQSLSEDKLEQHPQQVVFLTDNNEVMSQELTFFVGQRSYHDMDQEMEALLTAVVTPIEDEGEDEDIDIDEIPLDEGDLPPSLKADAQVLNDLPDTEVGLELESDLAATGGVTTAQLAPQIQPLVILGGHGLTPMLQESFVSYQETPHHTGDTLHVLKFALSEGLGLQELREAFGVDFDDSINEFVVNSARAASTLVKITGYIEVFLEVQGSGRGLGCVYLTSDGDIRRQPNGGEVEEPVDPTPPLTPEVEPTVAVVVAPAEDKVITTQP